MMKPAVVTRIRKELGLTGPELSKMLGGSPNLVWRWEHGVNRMSPANAQLLERILSEHRAKELVSEASGRRGRREGNGHGSEFA